MGSCPQSQQWSEYLRTGLPTELAAHLETCTNCRESVESAQADEELFLELREACQPLAVESNSLEAAPGKPPLIPGYTVESEIHRGGQGIVYRATQDSTRRTVALKVLLRGRFASVRERHRFEREVNLLASLRHPNIVTIFDSGIHDDQPYYAMEYIPGVPLHEHSQHSFRDPEARLQLFRQLCTAVHYAHQRGVIHRDLKPHNILIDSSGAAHVLDFGLAKTESCESEFATLTGEFVGTLAYAAPEQVRGDVSDIDVRTDVYALGVILYELLTGKLPYDLPSHIGDALATIEKTPPAPPTGVGSELSTILLQALAKDPGRRYASVEHFGQDIDRYRTGQPVSAKQDSSWYVIRKSLWRHRVSVGLALGFVTLIVTGLIVALVLAQQAARDRDRADESAYHAHIAAADRALQLRDPANAEKHLEQAPEHLRRWEWGFLQERLDRSLRILARHEGTVISVSAEQQTGTVLSVSHLGQVQQRSLAEGGSAQLVDTPAGARCVAWVDTDRWVVGYEDGRVELRTPDEVKVLSGPQGPIRALAVSSNQKWLAAGWGYHRQPGCGLHVWNLTTGAGRAFVGHEHSVEAVAFRGDNNEIASAGQTIRLWDVASGQQLANWKGHDGWVLGLTYSREGDQLISASADQSAKVWSLPERTLRHDWQGLRGFAFDVACHPDRDQVAVARDDGTIVLRNLDTGDIDDVLWGHRGSVRTLGYLGDGSLATGSIDGSVRLWDPSAPDTFQVPDAHASLIQRITVSHNGNRLASASVAGDVRIWSFPELQLLATLADHDGAVHNVAFGPEDRWIATAGVDTTIRFWDGHDYAPIAVRDDHDGNVTSLALRADGKQLASADEDGMVILWNTETWLPEEQWRQESCVHGLSYAPQGNELATVGHQQLLVWQLHEGGRSAQPTAEYAGAFGSMVMPIRFSRDGTQLYSGHERVEAKIRSRVQDTETTLSGHAASIFALAVHPDESRVATSSEDGTVRIWDARAGTEISVLVSGFSGYVTTLAFSADGRYLVAGDYRGQITMWDSGPDGTSKFVSSRK